MSDYVASPRFKFFKVHGSINWVRTVRAQELPTEHSGHQWAAANLVIENAATLSFSKEYALAAEYPSGINGQEYVAPAIAIPLEDKTDFECPADHLGLLQHLLPQTDRLLVVGWRATEQHFLRMLHAGLKAPIRCHIACGNKQAGEETAGRLLAAGIGGDYVVSDSGFTDMITRRELDRFLCASTQG